MEKIVKQSLLLALLSLLAVTTSFAQDAEVAEEVTDEELKKYAVLMDSVEAMKENVKSVLESMVVNNEAMTKARYNDLSKAGGKEDKLTELEATEEELMFMSAVASAKDSLEKDLTGKFRTLAKEYVTGKVYNKVKKALKADKEVKSRYETIYEEVAALRTEEEVEGEASAAEGVEGTNK